MNTTIQGNFQICISVPLKVAGIKKQGISYNRQEKNDGLISSIKFNEFVVVLTWKQRFYIATNNRKNKPSNAAIETFFYSL